MRTAAYALGLQRIAEAIESQAGHQERRMQPGAESEKVVERALQLGLNVIFGGPCALVVLGYHDKIPD